MTPLLGQCDPLVPLRVKYSKSLTEQSIADLDPATDMGPQPGRVPADGASLQLRARSRERVAQAAFWARISSSTSRSLSLPK
jgi:hypothetical protein